ncbi:flippase-like domain-containing protein [Rhodobacteraceae bacterium 2376]|uniref:Flippase-like domain-containing protein n=1 Tax=Rhabdonatronobacter sediminivivens TaxID=2743469 RepID=A0A7Z0HXK0_9RHOB|nr:lysylphosphatidylglycerol synthase transmembrane domain-containing protein [Rhabdonatronobacter sediminivivens]NYS23912.1 flippase-like domain-containing protein [Rhabdonatronobacter sediminivivens]
MRRRRWQGLARLAVTLGALALLLAVLGGAEITQHLRQAAPGWVALAAGLLAAQIILSALRWRLSAGALGLAMTRRAAVGEYFLSVLGNTLLPGGVLGDIGRAARARHTAGLEVAAQSVVIERLTGQVFLALAAALGLGVWLWPGPGAWGVALAAVGVPVAALWWLRRATGSRAGLWRRALRAARLVWLDRRGWRAQAGLSLLILGCNIGGFWAAAAAAGVVLSAPDALLLIPLTLMAMLLPVSVNGWGLREGVAATLWPLAGVGAGAAVAASILFGLAAALACLPGLWVLARCPLTAPAP